MTQNQATAPTIRVRGIEKSFRNVHVLRGVDFEVAAGSIFALLGANGAGKTTLVRILATTLRADAVIGILVLFTLALTWIAVLAGLSAKTVDGASAFSYPLIFLPFISSAFVPTDSMPGAVAWFAEHQPVTSIVDTLRALFGQQPVGSGIWVALGWLSAVLLLGYFLAAAKYRRIS